MAQASYAALGCPSDGLGWWHFYTALYKFTQLWCAPTAAPRHTRHTQTRSQATVCFWWACEARRADRKH